MVDAHARVKRQGAYVPCTITARPVSDAKDGDGLLLVTFQDRPARRVRGGAKRGRAAVRSTRRGLARPTARIRAQGHARGPAGHDRRARELERGAESLARRSHVDERGAPVDQRGDGELEGGAAVAERGAEHGQQSAPGQGARAGRGQQRHGEPAGEHRHRHGVSRRRSPHQALHAANGQAAEPAGRPTSAGRFATSRRGSPIRRCSRTAAACSRQLAPLETIVRADDGRAYLRRVLPYRTADNRISGVVITWVDITQRLAAEAEARHLGAVLRDSNDAVALLDLEGRIIGWNRGAERLYGYAEAEARTLHVRDLVPEPDRDTTADLIQPGRPRRHGVGIARDAAQNQGRPHAGHLAHHDAAARRRRPAGRHRHDRPRHHRAQGGPRRQARRQAVPAGDRGTAGRRGASRRRPADPEPGGGGDHRISARRARHDGRVVRRPARRPGAASADSLYETSGSPERGAQPFSLAITRKDGDGAPRGVHHLPARRRPTSSGCCST